jgi:hypothetical protein
MESKGGQRNLLAILDFDKFRKGEGAAERAGSFLKKQKQEEKEETR